MRLFLTVLLLAVLFSITQAAKWGNNQRFQNMCERNITGYRNYIDGLFNVSIKKLADVLLGEPMYTTRYKDVRGSTGTEFQQYMQLAKDIHDEVATPWNENQNGWIRRRVIYGLHVHENAFVKHANVGENQTALYQDELLILSKQARNLDTFIQGILIEVEYCGVRATGRDTYLEVDVKLTVDGTLLSLFDDNIMESSDQGFVLTYGILRWLLKDYIPQHPEDPVLISVQPTTEQIVIPSFFDSKDPFKSIKMMTNIPVTTVDPVVASSPTAFKILLLLLGAIVIVGIAYAAYRVVKKYVCPMIRISKEVRVTQNRFKNNQDEGLINEELAKRSRKESDV